LRVPPPPGEGGGVGGVVLVTGFEPFGGERLNPSWEICGSLPSTIAGMRVVTVRVPCEFGRAIEVACAAIERHDPALVICLGQAGGRSRLAVERVAIKSRSRRTARPRTSPRFP
jgi:pyroglutamyl-peptidase